MICPRCGQEGGAYATEGLCWSHAFGTPDNWAQENRVWCDYFHRGREIQRVDNFSDEYAAWRATYAP